MFINTTQSQAMSLAVPDVCKTPPIAIPAPFPNIAMSILAIPSQFKFLIQGRPAQNLLTITPISSGDEGGALGGVVSGVFIGPSRHILGSLKVFACCMPVTRMLDPTGQNGMLPNMVGVTLVPSQVKVMALS